MKNKKVKIYQPENFTNYKLYRKYLQLDSDGAFFNIRGTHRIIIEALYDGNKFSVCIDYLFPNQLKHSVSHCLLNIDEIIKKHWLL